MPVKKSTTCIQLKLDSTQFDRTLRWNMKISELPGQVSREVTVEKELRPVGPDEQTNISKPKLSHVSLDNKSF